MQPFDSAVVLDVGVSSIVTLNTGEKIANSKAFASSKAFTNSKAFASSKAFTNSS